MRYLSNKVLNVCGQGLYHLLYLFYIISHPFYVIDELIAAFAELTTILAQREYYLGDKIADLPHINYMSVRSIPIALRRVRFSHLKQRVETEGSFSR